MSEGPISRDRAARKSPAVTTNKSTSVHAFGTTLARALCGHKNPKVTTADWAVVTCSACVAAGASDCQETP